MSHGTFSRSSFPPDLPREPASWNLGQVVQELRRSREARMDEHAGDGSFTQRLPSRSALESIAARLKAALFPAHFGPADLTDESVDYFVGHTLGDSLRDLQTQAARELRYHARNPEERELAVHAAEVTREFSQRLPEVHRLLESDVRAAYEGDPAARSLDEALFCYPGVTAMVHHRLAHELYRLGVPLLARVVAELAHSATGIDIHPGAQIGQSFFIDHGTGVVIGETTVVGERVRIYQGVTLGAKIIQLDEQGIAHKGNERHPIVEDDVIIYAGATILGRIRIGRGSIIGGNVWLTRSVPPESRVTQLQPRAEAFHGGLGI